MSDKEWREALNILRHLSPDDLRQALDGLRKRIEERPGTVQISASGFSKSGGSASITVVGAQAVEVDEALPGDAVVRPATVATTVNIPTPNVQVPAVLVEQARGRRLTPEWAVAVAALWLVTASTVLSLQGQQEIAQAFDRLAAILGSVMGVVNADSDED